MNIKNIKENSDIAKSKIVSLDNGCLSYLDFSDILNTILSEAIQTDDMPVRAYSYIHDSLNSCVESGDFTILDSTGTAYTDLDFSAIGRIKLSKKNMSGYPLGEWLDLIAKPEYMVYMYKKEYPDDFAILKLSNKTDIVCGAENYSQYNVAVREASGKIENGKEYLFYVLFIPTIVAETDPTVPAHVKAITPADITNWNTETDPTVPSHVKSISTGDIANWNLPETDPTVPAHVKAITTQQIQGWSNGIYIKDNNLIIPSAGTFINGLDFTGATSSKVVSYTTYNSPKFVNHSKYSPPLNIRSGPSFPTQEFTYPSNFSDVLQVDFVDSTLVSGKRIMEFRLFFIEPVNPTTLITLQLITTGFVTGGVLNYHIRDILPNQKFIILEDDGVSSQEITDVIITVQSILNGVTTSMEEVTNVDFTNGGVVFLSALTPPSKTYESIFLNKVDLVLVGGTTPGTYKIF